MSVHSAMAAIAGIMPMMHSARWDSVRVSDSGIPRRRPRRSQPKLRILVRRARATRRKRP